MNYISKIRKLSLVVFIVPTLAINICLYIVIYIKLAPGDGLGAPTFPYIDGGTSISRTARVFPTYLIFISISPPILSSTLGSSTAAYQT